MNYRPICDPASSSKILVTLVGVTVALSALASSPALADDERGPRYQLVDYFSVGGGAVTADALNQAGVFTANTVTGTWMVNARTGEARRIDTCNTCTVTAVNGRGDVAGWEEAGGLPSDFIGFVILDGRRTSIPLGPGERITFPTGINDLGQASGFRITVNGISRAFLWQAGVSTDLGTFGGDFGFARAINDRSQVVGSATLADGREHAFLFDPKHGMRDIGTGTSWDNRANAVSSNGKAAGLIFTRPTPTEFVFHAAAFEEDGHEVRDLGTLPGLPGSEALGINRDRTIVGYGSTPDGRTQHAFLFRHGSMFDLNDLVQPSGLVVTQARAINDDGIIVGFALERGVAHAVALLPVKDD